MTAKKYGQTPRVFIVGTSESGKTLLAKAIAAQYERQGVAVTVYDPVLSEWAPAANVSDDAEVFYDDIDAEYRAGRKQALFIDEADTFLSIADKQHHWIMTRGRHFFLMPHVITQRPALVAPTVRGMCNQIYCFQVSKADAILLAADFAHEGLLEAPQLLQGEFLRVYWKDKKKTLDKGRIF